jgi:hypothetical protein
MAAWRARRNAGSGTVHDIDRVVRNVLNVRAGFQLAELQEWLQWWAGPTARPAPRLAIPLARAGYGAALLCVPGPLIRACTGRSPSSRARGMARVLGVRHLAQAAITAGAPGPEMFTVGSAIDLCHVASMLGLAAVDKSLRRAELADALVAAALAVAEVASAGPSPASDG